MPVSCSRCDRAAIAKGFCDTHYRAARRRGELNARERDPVKRFWSRVDKTGPVPSNVPHLGACWLWTAAADDKGYGRVGWQGRTELVHRVSYRLLHGSIPDELPLDHLCRVPSCVRPSHLEPVPTRVNTARGLHPSAHALNTGVCINGHERTAQNVNAMGRWCKRCHADQQRQYTQRIIEQL